MDYLVLCLARPLLFTGIDFNQTYYLGVTVASSTRNDAEKNNRRSSGRFLCRTSTYATTAGTSTNSLSAATLNGITPGQFFRNDQRMPLQCHHFAFLNVLQTGRAISLNSLVRPSKCSGDLVQWKCRHRFIDSFDRFGCKWNSYRWKYCGNVDDGHFDFCHSFIEQFLPRRCMQYIMASQRHKLLFQFRRDDDADDWYDTFSHERSIRSNYFYFISFYHRYYYNRRPISRFAIRRPIRLERCHICHLNSRCQ